MADDNMAQKIQAGIQAGIQAAIRDAVDELSRDFSDQITALQTQFLDMEIFLNENHHPRPVLPDVPLLTGPSELDTWELAIEGKFDVDTILFSTEPAAQFYYLYSRLKPATQKLIMSDVIIARDTETWDYKIILAALRREYAKWDTVNHIPNPQVEPRGESHLQNFSPPGLILKDYWGLGF